MCGEIIQSLCRVDVCFRHDILLAHPLEQNRIELFLRKRGQPLTVFGNGKRKMKLFSIHSHDVPFFFITRDWPQIDREIKSASRKVLRKGVESDDFAMLDARHIRLWHAEPFCDLRLGEARPLLGFHHNQVQNICLSLAIRSCALNFHAAYYIAHDMDTSIGQG